MDALYYLVGQPRGEKKKSKNLPMRRTSLSRGCFIGKIGDNRLQGIWFGVMGPSRSSDWFGMRCPRRVICKFCICPTHDYCERGDLARRGREYVFRKQVLDRSLAGELASLYRRTRILQPLFILHGSRLACGSGQPSLVKTTERMPMVDGLLSRCIPKHEHGLEL